MVLLLEFGVVVRTNQARNIPSWVLKPALANKLAQASSSVNSKSEFSCCMQNVSGIVTFPVPGAIRLGSLDDLEAVAGGSWL